MSNDPKIYGVIVEWKNEAPIIFESKPLKYEEAMVRAKHFVDNQRVIRVAVFKITYMSGNESLIEKESEAL